MAALWSFLLDRLDVERSILRFPSLLHVSEGALRILAKGNWKIESFLWGGRFDGRCSAQAEQRKKRVAVGPLPGAYLSTETNLVPIRGVMRKEFDTGQTDRQTHTHTHTHGIKAPWTARSPALARTWHPARMKIAPLGTCWRSIVWPH